MEAGGHGLAQPPVPLSLYVISGTVIEHRHNNGDNVDKMENVDNFDNFDNFDNVDRFT